MFITRSVGLSYYNVILFYKNILKDNLGPLIFVCIDPAEFELKAKIGGS